jgi:transcription antitermination factor NusG
MNTILTQEAEAVPLPVATKLIRHWFALYTAPNHEKSVQQQLRMKGIETFLPLYTVTKRWKNRTAARVQLPLFPSYVFAKIARAEAVRVLEVPTVHWIVGNGREALALPDVEIETLRSGLHLRKVDPYPYLTTGVRARIRSGPLAGLEGSVIRKDSRFRVVLSIDLIMKSIAVQVDATELEPLLFSRLSEASS